MSQVNAQNIGLSEMFWGMAQVVVAECIRRSQKDNTEPSHSKGLLSRKKAAEYLDVSEPTIDRLLKNKQIQSVTMPDSSMRRYTIKSLEKFIERHLDGEN